MFANDCNSNCIYITPIIHHDDVADAIAVAAKDTVFKLEFINITFRVYISVSTSSVIWDRQRPKSIVVDTVKSL